MDVKTELREQIARILRTNYGTVVQSSYGVADEILALPDIAEALRACEPGGELDVYRANCEYPD